ncbi:MAG: cupredoxin domain-containing protein [Gammaproteobacteria bacterium]|nr:MAG: cupredoxin domain-containing protein [Gammaproteobacteria bacterium]
MLMVNIAGLLLIALIIWWFWLYRPGEIDAETGDTIILVENGVYLPAHIKLRANTPTALYFQRKDPSPCAETVQFPVLDISETLPLNKTKAVQLPALAPGEYDFHCQMQMYRGQLNVE